MFCCLKIVCGIVFSKFSLLSSFGPEFSICSLCAFFIDLPTGGIQQEAGANEQEADQLCSHPEA